MEPVVFEPSKKPVTESPPALDKVARGTGLRGSQGTATFRLGKKSPSPLDDSDESSQPSPQVKRSYRVSQQYLARRRQEGSKDGTTGSKRVTRSMATAPSDPSPPVKSLQSRVQASLPGKLNKFTIHY